MDPFPWKSVSQPLIHTYVHTWILAGTQLLWGWGEPCSLNFLHHFLGSESLQLKLTKWRALSPAHAPTCPLLWSPPQHLTLLWIRLPCDFPLGLDLTRKQCASGNRTWGALSRPGEQPACPIALRTSTLRVSFFCIRDMERVGSEWLRCLKIG